MRLFLPQLLQARRIISVSKRNILTQVQHAPFQLIQLNFTKSENPHLFRTCYNIIIIIIIIIMVMSLKKAADYLEVKKRELSMK